MSKFGELIRAEDWKKEKHVPAIDLPADIKAGEVFDVTVTVGKEVPHPNTTEHFIQWIALFFKAEGEANLCQLGRADFVAHGASGKGANEGPAYTNPKVTFSVKLEKPGTLVATEYCNIHGVWEYATDVSF